jgi:hypothetical protein
MAKYRKLNIKSINSLKSYKDIINRKYLSEISIRDFIPPVLVSYRSHHRKTQHKPYF